MHLDLLIRDIMTNETRLYSDEYNHNDIQLIQFLWDDGNYACDCNRGLFFYGEEWEGGCGTVRFVIEKAVIRETGQVICLDDRWSIQ